MVGMMAGAHSGSAVVLAYFTSVWAPSVEDGATIGGEASPYNSGFMLPGGTITLTFSEPGVYNYGCFLHPGMYGIVVVEPAAA